MSTSVTYINPDRSQIEHEIHVLVGLFENLPGERKDIARARAACRQLLTHIRLNVEIVYPTARLALKDGEIVRVLQTEARFLFKAVVDAEHLEDEPSEFVDALQHLREHVRHYLHDEIHELIPRLAWANTDFGALGARLAARRRDLEDSGRAGDFEPIPQADSRSGAWALRRREGEARESDTIRPQAMPQ